jgi:fructose-1,6-bisphosphatase/inositol monophosphatase family enzyme
LFSLLHSLTPSLVQGLSCKLRRYGVPSPVDNPRLSTHSFSMNRDQIHILFTELIATAQTILADYLQAHHFTVETKIDHSPVTEADKHIDRTLSQMCRDHGLAVLSEESKHSLELIQTGNYMTIDPIDGTKGLVEHLKHIQDGKFNPDIGRRCDCALLLGLVQNGQPTYAAYYNYVTAESVFLDAESQEIIRQRDINLDFQDTLYSNCKDQKPEDATSEKLLQMFPQTQIVVQGAVGIRTLYTFINKATNSTTFARVESGFGLWDILPAMCASKIFGGQLYDGFGEPVQLDQYITIPGKGVLAIKGEKFAQVREWFSHSQASKPDKMGHPSFP